MDKAAQERFNDAVSCMNIRIKELLKGVPEKIKATATEVRLRNDRPVEIVTMTGRVYVSQNGVTDKIINDDSVLIRKNDILDVFHSICSYSVYSHTAEIKNGFVTLKGGHRVGMCGTAVFSGNDISSVKDISSINIRIAREIKGCADKLCTLMKDCEKSSMLIVGKPLCGKTTLLRDFARQLSYTYKTAVIDERGELAGTYAGTAQNDMGMCDIFNGYTKAEGIVQALRSMSPEFIFCDEIGSEQDAFGIEQASYSGVNIVATVHAQSIEDVLMRKNTSMILNSGRFKYIVFADKNKELTIYKEKEKNGNACFRDDPDNAYGGPFGLCYERQA